MQQFDGKIYFKYCAIFLGLIIPGLVGVAEDGDEEAEAEPAACLPSGTLGEVLTKLMRRVCIVQN